MAVFIAAAIVGKNLALQFGSGTNSDLWAFMAGMAVLAGLVLSSFGYNKKVEKTQKYKPVIVEILSWPKPARRSHYASDQNPDEAKRLARTILSDILLYNQAKVKEGIEKDSLFDVLTEELAEGKKYYESMVDEEIRSSTNFFNEAVVDVLLKQGGKIKSEIW